MEQRPAFDSKTETHDRFMIFRLGNDAFAISLINVKEVIGVSNITPVPNSPPYFKGVLNLRDHVISVLDLGRKLKASETTSVERAIIILDLGSHNIGVLVDGVESVIEISQEMIQPSPNVGDRQSNYVSGVIRENERLILLLDINEALSLQKSAA